jgi:hypothetical protein
MKQLRRKVMIKKTVLMRNYVDKDFDKIPKFLKKIVLRGSNGKVGRDNILK